MAATGEDLEELKVKVGRGHLHRRLNQLARQIEYRRDRGLPVDQWAIDEVAAIKSALADLDGKPCRT